AADTRDVDPEVVVAEDLLRRLAAECHSLRAPLRHSNTMPVPLAGEDETSRQTVLPAEDAERLRRSVRIPHVHRERALDRCAEELQLPHAFGVRRVDVLGLLGVRGHIEERAAQAEVVAWRVLPDVPATRRSHDLRGEHSAGAGEAHEVDPLAIADVDAARVDVTSQLRRRELRRPLPAGVTPR